MPGQITDTYLPGVSFKLSFKRFTAFSITSVCVLLVVGRFQQFFFFFFPDGRTQFGAKISSIIVSFCVYVYVFVGTDKAAQLMRNAMHLVYFYILVLSLTLSSPPLPPPSPGALYRKCQPSHLYIVEATSIQAQRSLATINTTYCTCMISYLRKSVTTLPSLCITRTKIIVYFVLILIV